MSHAPASTTLVEQLVHLARLGQSGPAAARLSAAQWTALRYFSRANRFSRTPSAFSEYQSTTRGTASQTVKSLVAMGLLERRSNSRDGRSALIELTEAGRAMLAEDPMAELEAVLESLPPERRRGLAQALSQATETLAERRGAAVFGTCRDCTHCACLDDERVFCRSSRTALDAAEVSALCVDFTPLRETPRAPVR